MRSRVGIAAAVLVMTGLLIAWAGGAFAASAPDGPAHPVKATNTSSSGLGHTATVRLTSATSGVRRATSSSTSSHRSATKLGTIKVLRELCMPPPPDGKGVDCGVYAKPWTGGDGNVSWSLDKAIAINAPGDRVATAKVKRGIFWMHLRPDTYKVELLWTSKHAKPMIAGDGTFHVKVRASHTTTVIFKGYAG